MPTAGIHPQLELPVGKLLEGIVTTLNADGTTNISPMGPIVDNNLTCLRLRPFTSSTTYKNLKRSAEGVLHVTDDVLLFALAATGRLEPQPELTEASAVTGKILVDACRWYAFRVTSLDDTQERTNIMAKVVDQGRNRDFFGFNRAKHAVIEAAILATRIDFLPAREILSELERLATPVHKTAGQQELRAFDFLRKYVEQELANKGSTLGTDLP